VVSSTVEQNLKAEVKEDQQAIVESHSTDQYLTFVMDEEEYGVDILSVQEIRGWEKTTKIPNSPHYLKGVINLRGTIVPIVDLRVKFNLASVEYTPITVVIVLKLAFDEGDRTVGIVVDAVSDVYSIVEDEIRESPDVTNSANNSFIKGLANVNDKMVIILELDKLLDENELPKNTEG
jgi:purine-binding chemotaxis protein CheW